MLESVSLYISLLQCLNLNGKSADDILWVGCEDFRIPIKCFQQLASSTKESFDENIPNELIVVGHDFWVERAADSNEQFDSTCWKFRAIPKFPSTEKFVKALTYASLSSDTIDKICSVHSELSPRLIKMYNCEKKFWMLTC